MCVSGGKKYWFFGKFYVHTKYDALRDFVLFALFKKRKKHPLRRVTFSKVAGSSIPLKSSEKIWQNRRGNEGE